MHRIKIFRNKKALSNIVSTLLMTSIVITLGITILTWSTTHFNSMQSTAESLINQREDAALERFIIERVHYTDTDGNPGDHKNITLYIRNVGGMGIEISTIEINGTDLSSVSPPLPQLLQTEDAIKLSTTLDNPWTPGVTNEFAVVSANANIYRSYWQAP